MAVCIPLTSNLRWAAAPGNVLLTTRQTKLAKRSVANVSQIAIDKTLLTDRLAELSPAKLSQLLAGVDVMLGR